MFLYLKGMSKCLSCWFTKLLAVDLVLENYKIPCQCFGIEFNLFFVAAGAKKLANKAALWYVPCSLKNPNKVMEVPPIKVQQN